MKIARFEKISSSCWMIQRLCRLSAHLRGFGRRYWKKNLCPRRRPARRVFVFKPNGISWFYPEPISPVSPNSWPISMSEKLCRIGARLYQRDPLVYLVGLRAQEKHFQPLSLQRRLGGRSFGLISAAWFQNILVKLRRT